MSVSKTFKIEDDMLYYCEVISVDKSYSGSPIATVKKMPIISKDAFIKCYKKWILGEDNDTDDHK